MAPASSRAASAGRPTPVNPVDLATGSYAIGWQLFLTCRRIQPLGGGELALIAARIALLAGAMLMVGLAPRTWLRIRVGAITVVRIGYLLLGGAATTGPPVALHYAATPGWAGLLRDWMRLLLGVRILHIATVAAALQQPVLATTAQQVILLLGSDVGGYCRSPLLSDPLTQRRLAGMESWLSTLLAGPLGLPLAGLSRGLAATGSSPRTICVSVLTFLNITLALLLPALLVSADGRGATALAPPSEVPRELQPQRHGIASMARRAARKAGAACAAADARLAALCSRRGLPWPHQLLLAHILLSLAWVLSITVAILHGM